MRYFFGFLAQVVSLYTTLCVVRVILSWMPNVLASTIGQVLSSICDPYLNIFRRLKIFRTSRIDFSPIVAFFVLSLVQSILSALSVPFVRLSFGFILSIIIGMIWSIVNFLLGIAFAVILIRLIFNLLNKDTFSEFWRNVDSLIYPLIGFLSKIIPTSVAKTYRHELIISITVVVVAWAVIAIVFKILSRLCLSLPI